MLEFILCCASFRHLWPLLFRFRIYYFIVGSFTEWQPLNPSSVPHVNDQEFYDLTLTNLVADAKYKFRVDVRQKDDDKNMDAIIDGKESSEVLIPCTGTPQPLNNTVAGIQSENCLRQTTMLYLNRSV